MKKILLDIRREGPLFCYFYFAIAFNLILVGPLYSYLNLQPMLWLGRAIIGLGFFVFLSSNMKLSLRSKLFIQALLISVFFLISTFFTTSIDLQITAFKDYLLPIFSILFVLFLRLNENRTRVLYQLMTLVAIMQAPFIFQQYFVEVHSSQLRQNDWDLIAGTFGFNPGGGGGNSAGLIMFLCFYITCTITKYREFGLSRYEKLALIISVICIFMTETKIVFLLFIFIYFSISSVKDFLQPTRLALAISSIVLLSFLTLSIYSGDKNSASEDQTLNEYIEKIYDDYFVEQQVNFETGEVSRIKAIAIWYEYQNDAYWPIETYFGWGLTTSKISNSHIPEAVTYGSLINFAPTQLTIYLWDIGIIGVISFYAILLLLLVKTFQIKANSVYEKAMVNGCKFIMLTCMIFPIYSQTLHASAITQILVLIVFAQLSRKNSL